MIQKLLITTGLSIATVLNLHAQAQVGDVLPTPLGFTEVDPSEFIPLVNPQDVEFADLEGQVILIAYHASW